MAHGLVLIDLQNDFLPTGALPVPQGDEVILIANQLMPRFTHVIASQDWHPANHGSFASNHGGKRPGDRITLGQLPQILWPAHCVQNTTGADSAANLDRNRISHITQKGTDRALDSYSAFFDNGHTRATDLHDYLRSLAITDLVLMGLATDYCVKFTALDARALGYTVQLVLEGCRGVNLNAGDVEAAVEEMRGAGVQVAPRSQITH